MIILKEEFKGFVRTKPELVKYVNSGEMTWQRFYEMWALYGDDEKVWSKYKEQAKEEVKETKENFSFSSLMDSLKNVDMNSVQKGIGNVQKAIELLQGLVGGSTTAKTSSYKPRQLFKKFED